MSLSLIILYSSCCLLLQDTVSIRRAARKSTLAVTIFFNRSFRPTVWVELSRPVTFCRNYANFLCRCYPTATYTELETDAGLCAFLCVLLTCWKLIFCTSLSLLRFTTETVYDLIYCMTSELLTSLMIRYCSLNSTMNGLIADFVRRQS